MQPPSRAQHFCTLCQELRAIIGEAPRDDGAARTQGLSILKQLRTDPYASFQAHERLLRLAAAIERWFSGAAHVATREQLDVRESLLMDLAHIETEQRLRSWLMDMMK